MPIAIDSSSPAIAIQSNGNTATVTSASFTPPAGSVLKIEWSSNTAADASPASAPTITDNLGTSLTYTSVYWSRRSDNPLADGQVAGWVAVVGTSQAMTVTVTTGSTPNGTKQSALNIDVLTGADTTTIFGASGKSGSTSTAAIAQNYTAQATGGWGFLAVCDWDVVGPETAGTGCTLDASANISDAITYTFVRRTTPDDVNGNTNTLNSTIPGTSTNIRWGYIEILPGATGVTVQPGSIPYEELIGSTTIALSTSPGTVESTEQIGNPSLSVEAQPGSTAPTEQVGSPDLTVVISPGSIIPDDKTGSASVIAATSVTPGSTQTEEYFGSPTVVEVVSPATVDTSDGFGSPTVTIAVSPGSIIPDDNVGSASILAVTSLTPGSVGAEEHFGSSSIAEVVSPGGIDNSDGVGSPAVTITVSPGGIVNDGALGGASTLVATTVTPGGIAASEHTGSPELTLQANPNSIKPDEQVGSPTITVTITVSPGGIPSQEILGNQISAILAQPGSIQNKEELGSTIQSMHLSPGAITSDENLGSSFLVETVHPGNIYSEQTVFGSGFISIQTELILSPGSIQTYGGVGSAYLEPPGRTSTHSITLDRVSSKTKLYRREYKTRLS